MEQAPHPLIEHLRATGETVSDFAERVGISRNHLYRAMRGESVTTGVLTRIIEETGGAVPVTAFFPQPSEPSRTAPVEVAK